MSRTVTTGLREKTRVQNGTCVWAETEQVTEDDDGDFASVYMRYHTGTQLSRPIVERKAKCFGKLLISSIYIFF